MKNAYLIILLCLASFWLNLPFIPHLNHYSLSFIDVGQGDAILIRSPTNCTMLIDGGPGNSLTDNLYKSIPANENKIDLLVLTHPHADHMDGLISVLRRYRVENAFVSGTNYHSSSYQEFNRLLLESEAQVFYPKSPELYNLCGVEIQVLFPTESEIGSEFENINDSSLVLRLKIKDNYIYLSGDAEQEVEKALLESGQYLKSDIMKAGHHGSRTSNTLDILKAVQPKDLVIQSGEGNVYQHPHPETLQKANQLGIQIKRNDLRGSITYYF